MAIAPLLACLAFIASAPPGVTLVEAAALAQELKSTPAMTDVVDIRDDAAFARTHIPQALHLPGRKALHRAVTKGRAMVLVYGRANPCPAFDLARQLQAAGFSSVRVLAGGMEAWAWGGFPLERGSGSEQAAAQERMLEPREAAALFTCADVTPVLVDPRLPRNLPPRVAVLATPPARPVGHWASPLVVVADSDAALDARVAALRKSAGPTVWWVAGGTRAVIPWLNVEQPKPEKCAGCGQ